MFSRIDFVVEYLKIYEEEETAFYEKYEEISEEQAYKALEQTEALYQKLETIDRDRLKNMTGAIPEIQTENMEIRIIYLLYCIVWRRRIKKIKIDELRKEGFTQHMLRALKVLIENGEMGREGLKERMNLL